MRLKHIAFDLDGTLIDTRAQIMESMLDCLDPHRREAARNAIGKGVSLSPLSVLRPFGVLSLQTYWRHHAKNAKLARLFFDSTVESLSELRARAVTLSIVTSLPAQPTHALLEQFGIKQLFDPIDTYASRPHRKPSPELFRAHLRAVEVEASAAAYVGDSDGDMHMANSVGAVPIGVAWSGRSPAQLIDAGADIIITSFRELVELANSVPPK